MNGILNILKPPAMSSSGAVGAVKRITGVKKAGHTGTLDPGAAGVLPICVGGGATKLSQYIMRGKKEYIAEAFIGVETDTLDSYGKVTKTKTARVDAGRFMDAAQSFVGAIMQSPPAYSAVKHEGQPLYKLARRGVTIEKEPRRVEIYAIELLHGAGNRFLLRIECSKGTYIRSLVSDIARSMGELAITSLLVRTESCGFRAEDAVTLDELDAMDDASKALIAMDDAVAFLPKLELKPYLYEIVTTGSPVDLARAGMSIEGEGDYRVHCKGKLIGIGRKDGDAFKVTASLWSNT